MTTEEICPHCKDWKGQLEKFWHEGIMVFTGCPRCIDAELSKSKLALALRERCKRAEDNFKYTFKYSDNMRDNLRTRIEHLETELDIRVLHPDWKMIHHEERVPARSIVIFNIGPSLTPYFLPKAAQIEAKGKSFKLINLHIGTMQQEHDLVSSNFEKPRRVNWSVISHRGIGGEMVVEVENEEDEGIFVSVNIWGEPVDSILCPGIQSKGFTRTWRK